MENEKDLFRGSDLTPDTDNTDSGSLPFFDYRVSKTDVGAEPFFADGENAGSTDSGSLPFFDYRVDKTETDVGAEPFFADGGNADNTDSAADSGSLPFFDYRVDKTETDVGAAPFFADGENADNADSAVDSGSLPFFDYRIDKTETDVGAEPFFADGENADNADSTVDSGSLPFFDYRVDKTETDVGAEPFFADGENADNADSAVDSGSLPFFDYRVDKTETDVGGENADTDDTAADPDDRDIKLFVKPSPAGKSGDGSSAATTIMPKIPRSPLNPKEEYGVDYGGSGVYADSSPTIGMDLAKTDEKTKEKTDQKTEKAPDYALPDPEQFFRTEADEKPMHITQGSGGNARTLARRERIRDLKRDAAVRTAGQLFGAVLLVLSITGLSVFLAYYVVRGALDFVGVDTNDFVTQVSIPPAATTEDIAEILHNNGIIDMPELFVLYSRLTGKEGEYLSGDFTLRSTMHYGGIADVMLKPKYYEEIVTLQITEGMTSDDIGALLEENRICTADDFREYYKAKQNVYNFEKRLEVSADKCYQLEGYLFPDTYEVYVCEEMDAELSALSDEEVKSARNKMKEAAKTAAQKMYSAFNNTITKEMYRRMYDMGMTLNDTVTLASMVQKEAATEEDMELVASVFLNRLRNSTEFPKLQSDVTLLYAENYIRAHIQRQDTSAYQSLLDAYNTYASDGLPPGPICNPGLDAVMAVLNAPDTDYFYFCADTTTLQVYYATTITEHEANLAMIGLNAGDAQAVHRDGEENAG
jgi:UPF0755 protein